MRHPTLSAQARAGIAALALAGLGACSPADERASASASDSAPVPAPTDTAPARPRLALDGGGLMLVDATTGSTRAIAFDMAEAQALAAIAAAQGAPTAHGRNADCGAGPMEIVTFAGGIHAHVQRGRFVGWSARPTPGAPPLTTMSGVGLGSTRADLDSAYAATVRRTTLGTEWSAGGLQGVLASTADTARITDLWAGASCVAR